jgi:putative phage-type endonuclease
MASSTERIISLHVDDITTARFTPALWRAVSVTAYASHGKHPTPSEVAQTLDKMQRDAAQVRELMARPQLEQRTPEWYLERDSMITASDLAQALGEGKFASQKDFYEKKCAPGRNDPRTGPTPEPMAWGIKYEAVACAVYRARTGQRVHEFGLLRHPRIPWIGASPDGITDAGIMVEIKCPWRRKIIPGEVPQQYYVQMQAQLDVCGLTSCDYVECALTEYRSREDFLADSEPAAPDLALRADGNEKGLLVERDDGSFVYPPQEMEENTAALLQWADGQPGKACYWGLRVFSVSRVDLDQAFIDRKIHEASPVWTNVLQMRADPELYSRIVPPPPPKPPKVKMAASCLLSDDEDD